ncbi:MAG: hypothetical protein ACRDO8_06720 [Nocardioidaceae bacterium]
MIDVTDRPNVANRMFELLLAFAGRIDDDALTDVRELLAVAEMDRALGLLAGCLAAGDIRVTDSERDTLYAVAGAVLLDPVALARVETGGSAEDTSHRFSAGTTAQDPRAGVLPAIDRTLDVLPGVRALHCVWRVTAAGTVPGPVPRRVVLVHIDAARYPAAVAYRLELALRRYGLDAVVEVLPDGVPLPAYHRAALAESREIPLRGEVPPVESTETMEAVPPAPPEPAAENGTAAALDLMSSLPHRDPGERFEAPESADAGAVFFGEDRFAERTAEALPPVEPRTDSFAFAPEPAPERNGELNSTERDLLAQLHEELGKREREQETGFAPPVSDSPETTQGGENTSRHSADLPTTAWPREDRP